LFNRLAEIICIPGGALTEEGEKMGLKVLSIKARLQVQQKKLTCMSI
jgi:hypothetical protein